MNKNSYNIDALLEYCNKNKICLINDYNNKKITRDTKIQGKCINNCQNDFNKTFRYLKNFGGYCTICTKKNQKDKNKKTCLNKFGVDNPFKSSEIINKIKKTNLEKYGFENPFQNENIKNKSKQTCFNNYGVEYSMKSEIVKNKAKDTCFKKYGVNHYMLTLEIQNKIKKTCLKNMVMKIHLNVQ